MNDQFKNIQRCSSFFHQQWIVVSSSKLIVATKIFKNIQHKAENIDHSTLTHKIWKGDWLQKIARRLAANFFKDAVQVSNSNLVQNANTLLTSGNAKTNPDQ